MQAWQNQTSLEANGGESWHMDHLANIQFRLAPQQGLQGYACLSVMLQELSSGLLQGPA